MENNIKTTEIENIEIKFKDGSKIYIFLNEKNPRTISEKNFEKLKKSIREFPEMMDLRPIVYDDNNVVLGGNMRLRALKELEKKGLQIKDSWFKRVSDLTEQQKREFIIKDNIPFGEWDDDMLANDPEWNTLPLPDWGLDVPLSFGDMEEDEFDAEDEYKKIEEPVSKIGEVYKLGEHRLLCGSSTDINSFEVLMGEEKAQLVFTDPPYNVNYKSQAGNGYSEGKYGNGGKIFNDNKTDAEFEQFIADFLTNCYAYTDDKCVVYMWYATKNVDKFRNGMLKAGFKYQQDVIWVKEKFVFGFGVNFHRAFEPCMIGIKSGKYRKNGEYSNISDIWTLSKEEMIDTVDVWFFNRDKTTDYVHPTQKPVGLSQRAFRRTAKKGDIVLECFGGSGSTLIGCEQYGLKCRAIELDPKYCDVIRKRYAKFIGKESEWIQVTHSL